MKKSRLPVVGILMGGDSRRMGSPKHLLPHPVAADRTWLEHIVLEARPLSSDLVLLGSGEVPEALAEVQRLDDAPQVGGPLAGLTAMARSFPHGPWLLLACDTPGLRTEDLLPLLRDPDGPEQAVAYALRGRVQYLPILLRKNALETIERRAASKLHSMRLLCAELRVSALPWTGGSERRLRGRNSPVDSTDKP